VLTAPYLVKDGMARFPEVAPKPTLQPILGEKKRTTAVAPGEEVRAIKRVGGILYTLDDEVRAGDDFVWLCRRSQRHCGHTPVSVTACAKRSSWTRLTSFRLLDTGLAAAASVDSRTLCLR
jgi:hypothetical protein